MAAPFEILPWAVIRGEEGLRGAGTVPLAELTPVLEAALERHGKALLWDMDGIESNSPQLDFLRRFEGMGLWVDAGVRHAEGVIDVLVAGADKAVVGTKSLWGLDELDKAFAYTDQNVVLQIDYGGRILHPGRARVEPTAEALLAWLSERGADTLLFVSPSGPLEIPIIAPLCAKARVYAGKAPANDLGPLQAAGAAGAIIDLWESVPWPS